MKHAKGMTFIGMLLTLAIVVVLGIVIMRVVPVYLQHYSVVESINALERIPKEDLSVDPMTNASILKQRLMNQFYVNGIEMPREKVKIQPNHTQEGTFSVAVTYQVTKPLIGNIKLLFDFDVVKEVSIGSK